jgi:hypothetical protein
MLVAVVVVDRTSSPTDRVQVVQVVVVMEETQPVKRVRRTQVVVVAVRVRTGPPVQVVRES